MPQHTTANTRTQPVDQARLPIFRAIILLQLIVAGLFGLGTFFAAHTVAHRTGFPGQEAFYYRLGGAATLGYAVVAGFALRERVRWHEIRIPVIATFTFNLAAVVGALLSLAEGDRQPIVFFVLVAAFVFTLVAGTFLLRNQGVPLEDRRVIEAPLRVIIVVATLAAAFFGLAPLFFARSLAQSTGFSTGDLFVLRQAAAGTLGYAAAGVASLLATQWAAIRLQVIAALVFNGLSIIAAARYLIEGRRSAVGILILAAAALFTLALAWGYTRSHEAAA